jgi:hypothetical protein
MTKKAVIKTKETKASVEGFLNKIKNEQQRKDSFAIIEMMKKASGDEPKMWGSAIIGFGNIVYTSPSGRVVDWMKVGFSPRSAAISLYLMIDHKKHADELKKLGKYKTGGGCIYVKKLEDIDVKILNSLIKAGLKKK